MNEHVLVSLIALSGFLVLALSALRSRQLNFAGGAKLAAIWISIFLCHCGYTG